jgi:hypothetical protein
MLVPGVHGWAWSDESECEDDRTYDPKKIAMGWLIGAPSICFSFIPTNQLVEKDVHPVYQQESKSSRFRLLANSVRRVSFLVLLSVNHLSRSKPSWASWLLMLFVNLFSDGFQTQTNAAIRRTTVVIASTIYITSRSSAVDTKKLVAGRMD